MNTLPSWIVIIAGLCSGFIWGLAINTQTEIDSRARRFGGRIRIWYSSLGIAGVIFYNLFCFLMVLVLGGMAGYEILEIGHAYPLSKFDRETLSLSILTGAGIGKYLRYLYWK